jgi:hypothetical protein
MATKDRGSTDQALTELRNTPGAPTPTYLDEALAPGLFESYTEFVKQHAVIPDLDPDTDTIEPGATMTPVVPLYVYGEGQHDYIATDFDAGQVMVRDGNDPSGKAWRFSEQAFRRFVARAQGKKLPDDDEEPQGESPIKGAIRLARRTAALVQADRDANERASKQPADTVNVEKVGGGGTKQPGSKG